MAKRILLITLIVCFQCNLFAQNRFDDMLDQIRANYPMVMHGAAMSIGAVSGIDEAYLKRVKALADRVEPLWISDHLCWIGGPAPEQLHDLYRLPALRFNLGEWWEDGFLVTNQ